MWEEIKLEYETTDITLKDLAEKHDVKLGTLKSRKSRESWERVATKKGKGNKKVATIKTEKVAMVEVAENDDFDIVIEADNLTDKQRLFCINYIKYWNAGKAAKKAGYNCSYPNGYYEIGSQLLKKTQVKRKIDELKGSIARNTSIEAVAIIQKYIDIAFADITDFATFGKKEVQAMGAFGPLEDDDGNPVMVEVNYVDFEESALVDGTIITEVKKGKDGVSVKLADKMKALEFLSKYTDILSEDNRKKLQEEKLRMDIDKTKAEINKMENGDNNEPIEILIKRKGEG